VKTHIMTSLRMTLVTIVLTGLAYPLLVTGIAQLTMPHRADGSLISRDGKVIGSRLIGQAFADPGYLQPRPSAAGTGYDPTSSGGSNLGATSQKLRDRVTADVARLRADNPDAPGPIPVELVAASASGLDPHLSPGAALWQAPRIAAARQRPVVEVEAIIKQHIEGRTFGLLGEPRVNVLAVNLALDEGAAAQSSRIR
jgi:potassium-transporting ATPase KdpC subunit